MKSNALKALILSGVLCCSGLAIGQITTIDHDFTFSSGVQNMWGPSFSPFSINQTITLFEESWNETFDTGSSGIVTVAGQSFGAGLSGNFSGTIGSKISLLGFTSGTVEVDYPVEIDLDIPTDLTYDQGDLVTISSDYQVVGGNELATNYPSVGEAKWDVYFQMGAGASATLCAFGCTTFPIIPTFNTPLITLNLVTANGNGIWYLGPADPLSPDLPGIAGWPYAKSPASGSCPGVNCYPWQVHIPIVPVALPDVGYGISGELTIPYVETASNLVGNDLSACGDSTYFNLNLELFQLIGAFLPAPYGPILSNLSGSESFGIAEVNWNFFSASIDANVTNNQCFDFQPNIYAKFEFPVAVEFSEVDPFGTIIETGTSSIINIEVGNDLVYKFPCYYDSLGIVTKYTIDGNFTNHTWDEISFDFLMSAFAFGLDVPAVTVVPGFTIPAFCVNVPYPCPTWSCAWCWCSSTVCTPAVTVPPIGFPGYNLSVGPLWSTSIPLGSISYDWFNQTWDLEGFSQHVMPAFPMIANQLGISNTYADVDCYGNSTGSINVTTTAVSSATPFVYNWSNGGNTEDISGLPAGPYELSAFDANGCQLFTGATILEPQLALNVTYSVTDKNCNGGVDDGSIDILVQGGTSPYSYSWTGPGAFSASSQDVFALASGTYTVTVVDSKGCQSVIPIIVNQPAPFGQVGAITNVFCNGNADGAVAVDVFGGELPYSYNWSSGQTYEDLTDLAAGNYTLTLTDGNGCINSQLYAVTQPATSVNLTAAAINVDCKYQSTGTIDITTAGGTPGYTYMWVNSSGVVLPFNSEDIVSMPADNYTVLVTDANGCQTQISQLVTEPAQALESTPLLTHINCFSDLTGAIDPVVSGGTMAYTYLWSTGATSPTLGGIASGTYALNVTDVMGCTATYNYNLSEPLAPLSVSLTGTDVLCSGENTGSVNTTVAGGTAGYSYLWSNGGSTSSIQNIIAGPYNVVVTDSKGCTINNNINILEPLAPLALTSIITDVDCFGNNSGSIDLSVTGGTTPYNYLWSNAATFILVETTEDIANQIANGYNVLVTDGNGCQETLTNVISGPAAPLSISGIVDDVNCVGLNDGAIDVTVLGGTSSYSYSWSNGGITEDITTLFAGNYILDVTDLNGCLLSESFDVIEPLAPLSIVTYTSDVKCNSGNDGYIESTVSGGTLPYAYSWSNAETTTDIFNLTAGAYTLTITDGQGCTAFTGAVINEPAVPLLVNAAVTDVSCYGYSDGEIVITITGGVAPYYFNWGNQNEILLNNPSETITDLIVGDYFIRVTDANGCINEQIISMNEPTPFVATYLVSDVICFGDSTGFIDITIAGGTLPYSTVWSDGQTTEDAINLNTGTYNYVITDGNACETRDSIFVDEPTMIDISSEIEEISCIDQTDGIILVNPYGGIMPYTFVWSNGTTTQNNDDLAPGIYDLTITDDNLCVATFNFEILLNNYECVNIPNTFTPEGDNYNDTWIIGNLDLYPNATVKVFNKWGNEIFSSTGTYEPWDGTHYGNPLPSEVYYYIIVLGNDDENEYSGTITIIR